MKPIVDKILAAGKAQGEQFAKEQVERDGRLQVELQAYAASLERDLEKRTSEAVKDAAAQAAETARKNGEDLKAHF